MELAGAIGLFYKLAEKDTNISPSHIAIYNALLFVWSEQKIMPLSVTRKRIMYLAKVRGTATFAKVIRDLNTMGYLSYIPSFDPSGKTQIFLQIGTDIINK